MKKLPKGWNTSAPGCWMKESQHTPFMEMASSGEIQWFNSLAEAQDHAETLEWWLISMPFPELWRVEEMDGYR